MNAFDLMIIDFLNGYSNWSAIFDRTIVNLMNLDLFKGGVLIGIIWALWFRTDNGTVDSSVRERLISSLCGSFMGLVTARVLALTLPFRYRPLHDPEIDFVLPFNMSEKALDGWSSFPSDHAVLFFALAFSFWYISRRLGLLSIFYVTVMIMFPRIYTGLHYPTDIIAGAALGFGFAWFFNLSTIRHNITKPFIYILDKKPGIFYFCFFIVSYQLATLFNDTRALAESVFNFVFKYLFGVMS
jgi:undecaprenyl-diphosphatase